MHNNSNNEGINSVSIEDVSKLMTRNLEKKPKQFHFCKDTINKLNEIYNDYVSRQDKRSLSTIVEKAIAAYYKQFKENTHE